MGASGPKPACRGGIGWIAPRRLTRFVGNGRADTRAIWYRKPLTTPRAELLQPAGLKSRFCGTPKTRLAALKPQICADIIRSPLFSKMKRIHALLVICLLAL